MKALSILQPWAWLIAHGHKRIENRSWSTDYRGLVLLHAGKQMDVNSFYGHNQKFGAYPFGLEDHTFLEQMPLRPDYELGGIVGYGTLTEVVTQSYHDPWFRGPYGFVFTNCHPVPLIPCRGQLKLFEVPSEVEEKMLDILRKEEIH